VWWMSLRQHVPLALQLQEEREPKTWAISFMEIWVW
jgi:hypothetical protein